MERTTIYQDGEAPRLNRRYRTGVSLHGHTSCSREQLGFLGGFRHQFPLIPAVIGLAARQHRRATGEALDIRRAGWRPPLDPQSALAIEADQLHKLDLRPIVSLTDHDDVAGPLALRRSANPPAAPVSMEWTVPFGATFVHLGVHNLPESRVREICGALHRCTRQPDAGRIAGALAMLHAEDRILIVLNHPLWDEAGIGAEAHRAALASLLASMGAWIHAIELNGLRSRLENAAVVQFAEAWRKPLISGGDRHGAEPNAIINLTNATTFSEFAAELRGRGHSHILFLPQYREPLRLRWLQTVWDIVRFYPRAPEGWRHWSDRFFYQCEDGVERSVAAVWQTSRPPFLSQALEMLRLAQTPWLLPALRFVLPDQPE